MQAHSLTSFRYFNVPIIRCVSCKLTVQGGGSSAGQRRLDFLRPSSSFNMGKKLLPVLFCNQCVNTSALTHAVVYYWWQCGKERAVPGPVGGHRLSGRRSKLLSARDDARLHLFSTQQIPFRDVCEKSMLLWMCGNTLHPKIKDSVVPPLREY